LQEIHRPMVANAAACCRSPIVAARW
jgi:hypothetical protein